MTKLLEPARILYDRRVSGLVIPKQFTQIVFEKIADNTMDQKIINWIYENTLGEFWYGPKYQRDPDNKKIYFHNMVAAFGLAHEATLFAMALPGLNTKNFSVL